jgi:SAM-dependent methyltransferase
MRIIQDQIDPDYEPTRALDFGCGVGRIVIPLARICEKVVGVDVSEDMLAEARRNCEERDLDNVALVQALDSLGVHEAGFDLVHTYIVLQHIPRRRGMTILSRLIDLVAAGGIGAIHVQYSRDAPQLRKAANWVRVHLPLAHVAANLAQGRPRRASLMQMNPYPIDEVFRLLQLKGCGSAVVRFTATDSGGYRGAMIVFRKTGEATGFG